MLERTVARGGLSSGVRGRVIGVTRFGGGRSFCVDGMATCNLIILRGLGEIKERCALSPDCASARSIYPGVLAFSGGSTATEDTPKDYNTMKSCHDLVQIYSNSKSLPSPNAA